MLSQNDCQQLLAPFSRQELDGALHSIHSLKAPSIDGLNKYFYKQVWSIVELDIYDACQNFFDGGMLFKPINCTIIKLIPKIHNARYIHQ